MNLPMEKYALSKFSGLEYLGTRGESGDFEESYDSLKYIIFEVAFQLIMMSPIVVEESTFDNLMELPMNMAGYMSVERASDECEEQVISAVDITIEEANKRCEDAVRQNIYSIERQDDDVMEQVMEVTRRTEECHVIIDNKIRHAIITDRRESEKHYRNILEQ